MTTSISASIHSSSTSEEQWDLLARLFPVQRGGTSQWVILHAEGVTLTFFGPQVLAEVEEPDELEPSEALL